MNNADTGWWITETATYKIHAATEAEAREIWERYWEYGVPHDELPMSLKDGGVEADWDWNGDHND